jgi:hypothetical protein
MINAMYSISILYIWKCLLIRLYTWGISECILFICGYFYKCFCLVKFKYYILVVLLHITVLYYLHARNIEYGTVRRFNECYEQLLIALNWPLNAIRLHIH